MLFEPQSMLCNFWRRRLFGMSIKWILLIQGHIVIQKPGIYVTRITGNKPNMYLNTRNTNEKKLIV